MITCSFTAVISVNKGRLIEVVNYQIKVSVIIKITICSPIRKGVSCNTRRISCIGKIKCPFVEVKFIFDWAGWHFLDYLLYLFLFTSYYHALYYFVSKKIYKVLICQIMINTIAYINIIESIIICIKK